MTKEEIIEILDKIDKEIDDLYNEGYIWDDICAFVEAKFEEVDRQ